MRLVIALLVVWVVLAILGAVIGVLKWLLGVAIFLIIATLIVGALLRYLRRHRA